MKEIILNLLDVSDQSFEDIFVMAVGFSGGDIRNELNALTSRKVISYDKSSELYSVIPQP